MTKDEVVTWLRANGWMDCADAVEAGAALTQPTDCDRLVETLTERLRAYENYEAIRTSDPGEP